MPGPFKPSPEFKATLEDNLRHPILKFPGLPMLEAASGFSGAKAMGQKYGQGLRSLLGRGMDALSSRPAETVRRSGAEEMLAQAPDQEQMRVRVMLEEEYQRTLDRIDELESGELTPEAAAEYKEKVGLANEYANQIKSYGGQT